MNKEKIVLIGGGDHCGNCIDVIEQEGRYEIVGIVDVQEKIHKKVLGYPIFATDTDLPELMKEFRNFFISMGHVGRNEKRKRIFNDLKKFNLTLPVIISPLAYVSKYATIGEGTLVMPFAFVDVLVSVGSNCIIHCGTKLTHEAVIEDHCHISLNSVIGKCRIGKGTFVGANSWVAYGIDIAQDSIIGSCSNVLKSIEESGVYAGNPARRIK